MICEECENVMRWRSTNQITHIAKYKCPICGHLQTDKIEIKTPVEETKKAEPRFYHKTTKDTYIVQKTINKQKKYVGTYGDEHTAKKVVDEMIKCDWNMDMVPTIREKLNIHKVGRSWFCS